MQQPARQSEWRPGWRACLPAALGIALAGCREPPYAKLPPAGDPPEPACPIDTPAAPALSAAGWTAPLALRGGDIGQIVRAAGDSDRVWAASEQVGLWRSDDAGRTWSLTQTPTSHTYGQVAAHPIDPDILVTTSDQGWITLDGGATFGPLGLPWTSPEMSIRGLAFDGDRLYAAWLDGTIHRSDDLGETWAEVGAVPGPLAAPAPPSGGHDEKPDLRLTVAGDGSLIATSAGRGVYRSTDGGERFAHTLDEPIAGALVSVRGADVVVASRHPDSSSVWYSADHGALWQERAAVDGALTSLWIDPDRSLWATTPSGLWSEDDGHLPLDGEGWGGFEVVTGGPDGALLVGHRLGVLGSTDGGQRFADWSRDIVDADLINIAVHPQCPAVVFAGTQCRSGLFRSTDWGQTFDRPVGVDLHYTMTTVVSPASAGEIWAASDDRLWWSADLGETWASRSPLGADRDGVHLHGLAVHPTDPARVMVGSVGSGDFADDQARIYRSGDRGQTWTGETTGLPETAESFHALHHVLTDPEVVLLGTFPAGEGVTHLGGEGVGMFRSTDGGGSWTEVAGVPRSVQGFAECGGRLFAATGEGAWGSADGGVSWSPLLDTAEGVKAVACHADTVLAIGPTVGVRRSDDGGATWSDWTGDLVVRLSQIHNQLGVGISPDGAVAYVAVPGEGVSARALE